MAGKQGSGGDNYVDPAVLYSAGSLIHSTLPRTRLGEKTGKRHTSPRRRHLSMVVRASQLGNLDGGTAIDRHVPYVYGQSRRSLRAKVLDAINTSDGIL